MTLAEMSLAQFFTSLGLGAFGSLTLVALIVVVLMAIMIFLMRGGFSLALFLGGFLMFGFATIGGVFTIFYYLALMAVGGAVALFFLKL